MKNKGFTLVEVMVAMLVLGVVLISLINLQYFISKHAVKLKEQTFATQKAIQIMEELRSLVSGSEKLNISVLDDYDDGATYNPILTIEKNVTTPSDPPSNNVKVGSGWKYLRRISVIKMPEEPFARRVYVRIYKTSPSNPNVPAEVLAETMSVLKTIKSEYQPTQVIDVYILSLENVPGWWTTLSTMRPIFESVIQDLQTRCPGLEIRPHWITRLAYGRDPQYTPYINKRTYTNDTPMPLVYFYPGLMRKDDGTDFYFYLPDLIQARINVDGTIINANSYSLCDMYNHAVRYPDEERLYNEAVSLAKARGEPPPEISYRMLLEKMNSEPSSFKNILLINLHGELLPLPPMRNYSDAAKDPQGHPNVRVVTHPEQLKYNSAQAVKLRVYAYVMNPDAWPSTSTLQTVTIYLPHINIPASSITVEKIFGNDIEPYVKRTVLQSTCTYQVSYPLQGGTLITLYNTPLRHPINNNNEGLPYHRRLYGLEYIPCPVHPGNTVSFDWDLTHQSSNDPKNTARWIITFSAGALYDGVHTIETRIGTDLTSGTIFNKPTNLSRTYVWVGVDPPVTEQYQFIGDPRHMPYKDVKERHGYNWYFRQINTNEWKGFDKATNDGWQDTSGWGGSKIDIDIPRYFQIIRTGLLKTQAIWTTMNGVSCFYYGIGGEFGSNEPPLARGIPFRKLPWSTSGETSYVTVDEILPDVASAELKFSRVVARTDNSWYARYWLGELYPDYAYSSWVNNKGNLPTGSGNYYRAQYSRFFELGYDRGRCISYKGSSSFINGKPSNGDGPFRHHDPGGAPTGSLTNPLGVSISSIFNLPLLSSISAPRPFTLNYGSEYPPEWNDPEYSGQRTDISVPMVSRDLRVYYESSYNPNDYDASSVIKVRRGSNTCYIVVSGLAIQGDFGTAQMGKLVLASMLMTFLDGGLYPGQDKISQVPLVEITQPTINDTFDNPSSIHIEWEVKWKRWDKEKYTKDYPDNYTEPTPIVYSVKYSNDNGRTWRYCIDNTLTTAGKKDHPRYTTLLNSYTWPVANLPRGSYIIRVECYRRDIELHYSYDQVQIYIFR